jgi:hypothetical protein
MGLEFSNSSASYQEMHLQAAIADLENAVVAFFWSGAEPRMGTLTVTLPDRTSSQLLGDRDHQLGLILGAQITAITGKMTFVSTNLPRQVGDGVGKVLLELVREIIGQGED